MKNRNDWHLLKKEKVLGLLKTDPYRGLDEKRVKRHRMRWGVNSVWNIRHASAGEIASAALFDLATLLLVISAVCAAMFDRSAQAGLIVGILLAGGLLRTITYVRACRILENMAREKIPSASVIRGGRVHLIPADEVVVGDIVYLEEGDTVPCDGRVIDGEDSLVDESGITENREPVHKFDTVISTESVGGEVPCEYRSNCVFAGARVIGGSLRIAATAVGYRTLVSMKQGGIAIEPAEQLPMVERLAKRSRNTSLVMIACVLLLTALSMLKGMPLIDVFLSTMAMATAAMSEFLSMLGTIIIAVTVRDCASDRERGGKKQPGKSRVVIREPAELEKIAGITRIVFCGSSFFKSGRMELCAYRTHGIFAELDETGANYAVKNGGETPDAGRLLNLALAASAADHQGLAGSGVRSHEASEFAGYLLRGADAYAKKTGKPVQYGYSLLEHMDACTKSAGLSLSLIVDEGEVRCAACGRIDAVLRACTMADTPGGAVPITDEMRREIYTECARLEFSGAKVIAVSHRISPFQQLSRVSVLTEYMTFAGFLAVSQEWEKNSAENIGFINNEGICPILFTEDAEADLYYGHRLGLFDKRTRVIDALSVTPESFRDAPRGVIVSFAGIDAAHLSHAYEGAMRAVMADGEGQCTAAVGRKNRDAGVLALADVGCAAADSPMRPLSQSLAGRAVLTVHPDRQNTEAHCGGLDGLIRGMHSSRQALENVESAKLYLTSAQCARLILMLAAVLLPVPMMTPFCVLAWGLLFDFAAILVMAFEAGQGERIRPSLKLRGADPDDADERPHSRRGILIPMSIGAFWGAAAAGAAWLYLFLADLAKLDGDGSTFLGGALILSGLAVSCSIMKPGSIFRPGRINMAYRAFALAAVLLIPVILLTASLSWMGRLLCFGMMLVPALLLALAAGIVKKYRVKNITETKK